MDGIIQDRTDIKIFILFLLNEIDYPLDYFALCEVISENHYVGSFDFAECFAELCRQDHIVEKELDGVKYYRISETGKLVATELQDNLSESIREKSRQSAARVVSLYMRGAKLQSSIETRKDGQYTVHCAITEDAGTLLAVDLSVSSAAQAEKIRRYFESKPEAIFRGMLAVMTGEVDYLLS